MPALVMVHLPGVFPLRHGRRLQGIIGVFVFKPTWGHGEELSPLEAVHCSPSGLLSIKGSVPLSYPHPYPVPPYCPLVSELFRWSLSPPCHCTSSIVAILAFTAAAGYLLQPWVFSSHSA